MRVRRKRERRNKEGHGRKGILKVSKEKKAVPSNLIKGMLCVIHVEAALK